MAIPAWLHHDMKNISVLLAFCEEKHRAAVISPLKGPVMRNFNYNFLWAWKIGWANSGIYGDLWSHDAHMTLL